MKPTYLNEGRALVAEQLHVMLDMDAPMSEIMDLITRAEALKAAKEKPT